MRPLVLGALLAMLVAGASWFPVTPVQASTVPGSAVPIKGLDDLSATADQQARGGAGKVIAMLVALSGFALIPAGRPGLGLSGIGAGLGMGFVPGIISSAFDSAPAATGAFVSSVAAGAWWAPLTAGLYPGLLVLRVVQDPVVLAAGLLAVWLVRRTRPPGSGLASS